MGIGGPFGQQYFANIIAASPHCTPFNHGRLGTSLRRLMDLPWTQKAAFLCRYFYHRYFLWFTSTSDGRYFCIDLGDPYILKARVPGVLTLRYTHIHYIFMIYAFFSLKSFGPKSRLLQFVASKLGNLECWAGDWELPLNVGYLMLSYFQTFTFLPFFSCAGGDWELALNVGHESPLGSPKTFPGQQNFGQSTSWNSAKSWFYSCSANSYFTLYT